MCSLSCHGDHLNMCPFQLFIERKGLYDRGKDLSWKNMKDVMCVGAMGPPGGARWAKTPFRPHIDPFLNLEHCPTLRNPVDPRFMSLFNVFEIQFPATENLKTIYQAILSRHLVKLPTEEIKELMGEKLTDLTLELYNFICEKLPPTPSRFHYVFNLRDLSRVYEGLLLSTADKVTDNPFSCSIPNAKPLISFYICSLRMQSSS